MTITNPEHQQMVEQALVSGRQLSALNGEFYDYVEKHQLNQKVDFAGLADTPMMKTYFNTISSWPLFISPEYKAEMAAINNRIPTLVYKAVTGLFGADVNKMAEYFGIPAVLCALFADNFKADKLCFRSDIIATEQGCKALEFNLGTNIGGWQVNWMDELFRFKSPYRDFFNDQQVNVTNVATEFFVYLLNFGNELAKGEKVNVVLRTAESEDKDYYGNLLNDAFENAKKQAGLDAQLSLYSRYDQLKVTPQGLYFNDTKIHIVTFGDTLAGGQPPIDMLRLVFSGLVRTPDSPALIHVLSDKRTFPLLYEAIEKNIITGEEAEFVKRVIPTSYVLDKVNGNAKWREEVYNNKDKFVIKPCGGFQGNDVSVGRYMSDSQWHELLQGVDKPELWIIQEYCQSCYFAGYSDDDGVGVFDAIWGVFQFGQQYGGCWVRNLEKRKNQYGVINSHRGAQDRIVYEATR